MRKYDYLLSGLQNAPQELTRASSAIPDPSLPLEGYGNWSLHKIVFYLCEMNEQVYTPRLEAILESYTPQFEDFNSDAWMEAHYKPEKAPQSEEPTPWLEVYSRQEVPYQEEPYSFHELAAKFADQCNETADMLEDLADEDWERCGTHPVLGTHSLEWWVERMLINIQNKLADIRGE